MSTNAYVSMVCCIPGMKSRPLYVGAKTCLGPSQNNSAAPSFRHVHNAATVTMKSRGQGSHSDVTTSVATDTSGCEVEPAQVSVWIWYSGFQGEKFSETRMSTTAGPRDASGNLIGSILLTTGAYERSGNWTALISTKTLYVQSMYTNELNSPFQYLAHRIHRYCSCIHLVVIWAASSRFIARAHSSDENGNNILLHRVFGFTSTNH